MTMDFLQGFPELKPLMRRGSEFLGCPLPIVGGAMTWVSDAGLVAATSEAGGFGVLACGAMTPDLLRAEIQNTRTKTHKPFGVNLILMHPDLDALIRVCVEEKVSHVFLAGGIAGKRKIEMLHGGGAKVLAFAPALILAKRLVRDGVDALLIEGSEAGGHVGPVSTGVLAQEILPEIQDVPVFVAGGIGRGRMMRTYLEMGASGIQLGTLLVCATESRAHPKFKEAFIKANARDAVLSPQFDTRFPVIPVRAIANAGMRAFLAKQQEVVALFDQGILDQKAAQLEIEHFWTGALRRAVMDGDIENGSLMAGQSVGFVRDIKSVHQIFTDFLEDAFV